MRAKLFAMISARLLAEKYRQLLEEKKKKNKTEKKPASSSSLPCSCYYISHKK